jgi:small GTP-binding protein
MEQVDLKLVLLGQPGVGKTCLVYRYLYNTFGETISTIGASFAMKKVEVNGRACNLGIWVRNAPRGRVP